MNELRLDPNSSVLFSSLESSYNAKAYLCDIPAEKDLFLLNVSSLY